MEKMLAVVFTAEKAAYEGAKALSELVTEDSITVYAAAVIQKGPDGTVSTKRVDGDFPVKTVVGTALGSLIGVLGGPAGIAAGAGLGAMIGAVGDVYTLGLDEDFLADVSTALKPGKWAVVADIEEEWVTPVDTRMEALGGVVYRTPRMEVRSDHWSRDAIAAQAELDQLKAEHAQAKADRKAKLEAQIDRLRKRITAKLSRDKTRSEQIMAEAQAKVAALQKKADHEKGASKAAIEARIAQLRHDLQHRPQA